MGDFVAAVYGGCRSRRKDSSTVLETATTSLPILTVLPTQPSLKSSALSLNSKRSESNAEEKFRSAEELREGQKKAQERKNRWDARARSYTHASIWSVNTPAHWSGAASSRRTPQSRTKHSDNDRSRSPATLRLSDLARKPTPMSQYAMADPCPEGDAPAAAPAPPAPSIYPSLRASSSSWSDSLFVEKLASPARSSAPKAAAAVEQASPAEASGDATRRRRRRRRSRDPALASRVASIRTKGGEIAYNRESAIQPMQFSVD